MADVAIIHSADKGMAAARLAEAIAAAGFAAGAVEIEQASELAETVEGCAAEATILIWSRPLVSHALHSGELTRIRRLHGLIEVSADGIAPPSQGDDLRVVSISGWRGQPFHPGWQRIQVELKRLCGPRKALAEATLQAAAARDPSSRRAEPATPAGGASSRPRRLMLAGGAAVLLVAGALGAAGWLGGSAPDAPPRTEVSGMRGPVLAGAPRPEPATGPVAEPGSMGVSGTAQAQVDTPAPPPVPEAPAAAEAKSASSKASPAVRPAPAKAEVRPRPRPSPRPEPVKKYSRKNSKVMRQFCERSGRSTPQCRTFLRSVGGGDGD